MSEEYFWLLFSKKISGQATEDELATLEALIEQNPKWQYSIQNLEQIWKSRPPVDIQNEEDAYLLHLQRMKEKNISLEPEMYVSGEEQTVRSGGRVKSIALLVTSIAAAIIIAFFILRPSGNESQSLANIPSDINEISTRPGSKSRIQLPDNTIVWLNAGSKITYKKDFGQSTREIELSGEAYFDVVRDENKPFIIQTSSVRIRVLGTAFNVKDYPGDKRSETSLVRGRIEISIKSRPNDKIILSPNEKLIVENLGDPQADEMGEKTGKAEMIVHALKQNPIDSTIAETQWLENRLVFENESFEDLARKMERWYGVEIEIEDEELKPKRFTGNFKHESIEQAIEALRFSTPFVYKINGNKILIHH